MRPTQVFHFYFHRNRHSIFRQILKKYLKYMAGIYLHIPFCKQRCKYCAFYSSTKHSLRELYVNALCHELTTRRNYIKEDIKTIYFGGGTPSLLTPGDLAKILDTIGGNFEVTKDAETTIEANPDDLSTEYLEALLKLSFNRLSMGVQSFSDRQLQALGRRHDAQKARKAFLDARAAGFQNISIDLMFALPSSSGTEWQHSLQCATELSPEHISAYNLTYEEDTPLYNELQKGNIEQISEEENIAQFEQLMQAMENAGYRHYEISNFAKPGYESKHNSSYWNGTPYLGCGAAAHSYNGASRRWNISDIEQYIIGIEKEQPLFQEEHLSIQEKYNDTILTRLRTSKGICTKDIQENFGSDIAAYMAKAAAPHIASGCLEQSQGCISLTRKGIFISDYIIRDLIMVN